MAVVTAIKEVSKMKIKKQLVKEIIRLLDEAQKGGGSGAAIFEAEKTDVIKVLKMML